MVWGGGTERHERRRRKSLFFFLSGRGTRKGTRRLAGGCCRNPPCQLEAGGCGWRMQGTPSRLVCVEDSADAGWRPRSTIGRQPCTLMRLLITGRSKSNSGRLWRWFGRDGQLRPLSSRHAATPMSMSPGGASRPHGLSVATQNFVPPARNAPPFISGEWVPGGGGDQGAKHGTALGGRRKLRAFDRRAPPERWGFWPCTPPAQRSLIPLQPLARVCLSAPKGRRSH
jgi:hypothetical protein